VPLLQSGPKLSFPAPVKAFHFVGFIGPIEVGPFQNGVLIEICGSL
jgi:hypothetical protein